MTMRDDFTGTLSAWLDEQAGHRTPDYLDETLARTSRIRQRPAWSSLERFLPMQTSLRLLPLPRIAWLLVILGLLIAVAATALLTSGSRPRLPAPFGPARNGALLYATPDGNIYALDLATGTPTAVLAGPEIDLRPILSSDGLRLLFDRTVSGATSHALMVANADGSQVRPLTAPVANVDSIAWSPDGLHVSMSSDADDVAAIRVAGLDGTTVLVLAQAGATATEAIEDVQWQPDGRHLIFRGWSTKLPSFGLYSVQSDGADLRPIVPATTDPAREFGRPALSPDGSRVAYTVSAGGAIHIVDIASGIDDTPSFAGANGANLSPIWSPDGRSLAFQRVTGGEIQIVVAPAIGGTVVATGPSMPLTEGGVAVAFSPDGRQLVARYASDGSTWILDALGGPGARQALAFGELPSWQRLP